MLAGDVALLSVHNAYLAEGIFAQAEAQATLQAWLVVSCLRALYRGITNKALQPVQPCRSVVLNASPRIIEPLVRGLQ